MEVHYSKIGCRRTDVFRVQARRSYLQAIADVKRPKSHKNITFLVQAVTFLYFQAGRSSASRSSASDLTVIRLH